MSRETREQRDARRQAMGLANPKKDWWARRKRYYQPMAEKLESIVQQLKWWQRIYIALVLGFRKLWRRIKKKK